ncbi:hypothetical protein ISCGN_013146 [Ixodes scapularis]
MSSKHPLFLVVRILNKGHPPHQFLVLINRRRLRKTRLRHPSLDFLMSGKHPLFLVLRILNKRYPLHQFLLVSNRRRLSTVLFRGKRRRFYLAQPVPPSSTRPFSPIRSPLLLINEHQPSQVRFLLPMSVFKRHSNSPFTCSLGVWIIVMPPTT